MLRHAVGLDLVFVQDGDRDIPVGEHPVGAEHRLGIQVHGPVDRVSEKRGAAGDDERGRGRIRMPERQAVAAYDFGEPGGGLGAAGWAAIGSAEPVPGCLRAEQLGSPLPEHHSASAARVGVPHP